ncbi:hypothetical protein CAOG_03263, partial [Capsaspora owczarzaki ATCC 30864]|uniref:hypothetical protein n=1 Tax=Capsaspora owczarzaki (strain ATCC 30864) TaxID=595528 RepID=UPI00035240F2
VKPTGSTSVANISLHGFQRTASDRHHPLLEGLGYAPTCPRSNGVHFLAGFAALPWLHLINILWFFNEARRPGSNPLFKRYLLFSAVNIIVWIVALAVWIPIYQSNRASWGSFGDDISIVIPKGIA